MRPFTEFLSQCRQQRALPTRVALEAPAGLRRLPEGARYSAALKLYIGRRRQTISAVGPMLFTISSMLLYAIGDSSSVSGEMQVDQMPVICS